MYLLIPLLTVAWSILSLPSWHHKFFCSLITQWVSLEVNSLHICLNMPIFSPYSSIIVNVKKNRNYKPNSYLPWALWKCYLWPSGIQWCWREVCCQSDSCCFKGHLSFLPGGFYSFSLCLWCNEIVMCLSKDSHAFTHSCICWGGTLCESLISKHGFVPFCLYPFDLCSPHYHSHCLEVLLPLCWIHSLSSTFASFPFPMTHLFISLCCI